MCLRFYFYAAALSSLPYRARQPNFDEPEVRVCGLMCVCAALSGCCCCSYLARQPSWHESEVRLGWPGFRLAVLSM